VWGGECLSGAAKDRSRRSALLSARLGFEEGLTTDRDESQAAWVHDQPAHARRCVSVSVLVLQVDVLRLTGCGFLLAAVWLMKVKKLPFAFEFMHPPAGLTPEFLQLNPNGLVPVLQDGDFTLFEGCVRALVLLSTAAL
jgi:hypothetical protein